MSQLIPLEPKDPNDVKDYAVNWTRRLGADTLLTSEWIVPAGIMVDSESNSATTATIWLSGGTSGTDYQLTNRVTTAQGRQYDKTITVRVRDL